MENETNPHPAQIEVAVISASPALRMGLCALLKDQERLLVTAEAASLTEIGKLPRQPEVLILAASGESLSFLSIATAESPGLQAVLVLTDEKVTGQDLARLPLHAAWGILPLNASPLEISAAVEAVHAGLWVGLPVYFAPLSERLNESGNESGAAVETLTPRETEVLQFLAQGFTNKQIALKLSISEHTVKFHISSIYSKLNATSRTDAVRIGSHMGLVSL